MISFRVYRRDDLLVAGSSADDCDARQSTLPPGCCRDGHTVAANTPAAQHEHVRPVPRASVRSILPLVARATACCGYGYLSIGYGYSFDKLIKFLCILLLWIPSATIDTKVTLLAGSAASLLPSTAL